MFWFGFASLLGPLIGVVLIAWAVHTIWRTVTLPRGTPREPACERCKYPVAGSIGVAGFTCPECGSDLRAVGIITPTMEIVRRGSVVGAVLAWTFLWGTVSYMALMAVAFATSFGTAMSTAGSVTSWKETLTPVSPIYRSIDIEYDSNWQSIASPIELTLTPNTGHPEGLALDPGPMTVIGLEGGQAAWDAGTIELWFAQIGLDTGDPRVAAAAAEVSRAVDVTVMSPSNGFTMNLTQHTHSVVPVGVPAAGASTSIFETAAFWLLGLAVVVLVYVAGIVGIVTRRRRLVRRARASGPAAPPPAST